MERTYKGTGIVWDPENNKTLCRFVDGEYTTSDAREQKIINRAFGIPDEEPEEKKDEPKEITKPEVMAMLDEKEIKYNPRDKKEKLLKLLED